ACRQSGPELSSTVAPTAPATPTETGPASSASECDATADPARFDELAKVLRSYTSVSSESRHWDFIHDDRWLRIEVSPVEFVESLIAEFGETVLNEIGLH